MNQLVPRSETVSEYLIQAVFHGGTRVAFVPTGRDLFQTLGVERLPSGLEVVPASHEAGAAFMADGYARVSGQVGLCLTSGAGAVSAAAGVLGAQADGSPLLVIVGGGAAGTSVDGLATLRPVTGFCEQVNEPAIAPSVLARAWSTLHGWRAGAAVLGLPANVACMTAPSDEFSPTPSYMPHGRADLKQHFAQLLSEPYPLLFLGSGARRALEEPSQRLSACTRYQALLRAVERHAIPVLTSPRAKGVFPETHELSLGCDGPFINHFSQRYARLGIGCCLVVGSGLGEQSGLFSGGVAPGGLVRVDVDPNRTQTQGSVVHAEAGEFLDALIGYAFEHTPSPMVAERRALLRQQVRYGSLWDDDSERSALRTPQSPQRAMSELQAVLNHHERCRAGVNLFCDGGDVLRWASQHLVLEAPHKFWCNIRRAALGWAGGAVVGGKLAQPELPSISVLRTRALLASSSELEVAVRRRVGAVWLVLAEPTDDEAVPSESYAPERSARAQRSALFDLLASLHVEAREVREPGVLVRELGEALESAAVGIPQVLVMPVQAACPASQR